MENTTLEFKKTDRRLTMSISIDRTLRKEVIAAAEKEGISVSSYIEQIVRFVMPEKKEKA